MNRNDDTVSTEFAAGRAILMDGELAFIVGVQRTGSFPPAEQTTPAQTHDDKELTGVR